MAHFLYKRYDWDASIRFILTRFHHRFIHIALVQKPIPSIELNSTSEREKKKWKIHTFWALFAFYQMFRCIPMFGWNILKAKPFLIFSPSTSTHPFLLPFTCFLPMWFFLSLEFSVPLYKSLIQSWNEPFQYSVFSLRPTQKIAI